MDNGDIHHFAPPFSFAHRASAAFLGIAMRSSVRLISMDIEQLFGASPPMGLILALRFLALVRESGASQKDAFIALGVAERLVTTLPDVPMVPTDEA